MRIPENALRRYRKLEESDIFFEGRGPWPVEALNGLSANLSEASRRPGQGLENSSTQTPEREEGNGAKDRRHGERRKTNTPSTLDTRVTRNRRKSAWSSPLSIKI
jgi:hypothetical protein